MNIRTHSRNSFHPKPDALRAAMAVCLILLILLAVVHVAFAHSIDTDADHCPLCIVMHSVLQLLILMVAVLLVRIATTAAIWVAVRSIIRYWHPTLFTRPPPRPLDKASFRLHADRRAAGLSVKRGDEAAHFRRLNLKRTDAPQMP
jgi:hypothetical protein